MSEIYNQTEQYEKITQKDNSETLKLEKFQQELQSMMNNFDKTFPGIISMEPIYSGVNIIGNEVKFEGINKTFMFDSNWHLNNIDELENGSLDVQNILTFFDYKNNDINIKAKEIGVYEETAKRLNDEKNGMTVWEGIKNNWKIRQRWGAKNK